MIQNITNKKTILAVVCATALAGCLDDPYQEPSTTPPPIAGDVLPLYGPDANSDFQLTIVDKSGVEALVEESGSTIQGNISATHVSGQNSGAVNVVIKDSGKGRVLLQSADSSHVAFDIDPATATLQFDSRTLSKPEATQDIFVTMKKELSGDVGKVSLTSSFLASYNSAPQIIKVPLSCFTDAGMDFDNVISPFALESASNLNFDLSNVRILTNSTEHADVIGCDSLSTLLQPDDDNDTYRASSIFKIDGATTGWATAITNWMTVGGSTLHWGGDNIRIEYNNAPAGENGGLVLATPDGSFKDLADYIDSGVLQFMFNVPTYANHPTKRFQVQMESSTSGNSEPYFLAAGTAENSWVQVQIPLRELFTRADGSININALRSINKPLSILPEWVDANHSLQGMEFSVGSVQIVEP